ncbi:hypothetical protein OH76DRAFT_1300416, partial [Lentinus brumalis]
KTSMSILEVYLLGSREEYIDDFFTRIPPDVILRMRCLSSSVLYAVEAYMYRHWNVSGTLSRWFYNVRTFLIALEACDAIVSGGAAVAFFARQDYPDADLEIYIPIHGLLPMGRFLRRQGYAYQAAPGQHPFFDAAVLSHTAYITTHDPRRRNDPHYNPYTCTYHFVLPLDPEFREGKHIRLVSVLTDPVEYMLRNSKSTGTMNYLTGTHAVSLFPRTTFVARTLVHCQDTSRSPVSHQTWTNKYRARGFSVVDAGVTLPNIRELRKWERRVGDKLTWVLPYKRIGTAERPPIQMRSYAFEVLDVTTEVTAAGAALRVGPRFWYSSMAYMRKPMKSFSQYRSIETAAAFLQDF